MILKCTKAEISVGSPEEAQELDEDEYYIGDLIGMEVVLEDNTHFGTLKDVMETGANDVYVVELPDHQEVLLPMVMNEVSLTLIWRRK